MTAKGKTRKKPASNKSRIRPVPVSKMHPAWLKTLERIPGDGLKGQYFPKNVLGTLMHNKKTVGPFLEYWVGAKLDMGFSVREQELVILRMGYLYCCEYVWKHHVPVAEEFGVTEKEFAALKKSSISAVFPRRERALLVLTDEMVEHRTIRQAVWNRYKDVLSKSEWVDLIGLISQYVLFALTNNAMQVELEETLADIPGL